MIEKNMTAHLMELTATAAGYCALVENAMERPRGEFLREVALMLPKVYLGVAGVRADEIVTLEEDEFFAEYVDEDLYESVRRGVAARLGGDDVYLDTFEEDMKYSDTPIACTVSEGLADIFQVLYDYVGVVKDTEGEMAGAAFRELREKFDTYWGQTLCNVMRPVNDLWHRGGEDEEE